MGSEMLKDGKSHRGQKAEMGDQHVNDDDTRGEERKGGLHVAA